MRRRFGPVVAAIATLVMVGIAFVVASTRTNHVDQSMATATGSATATPTAAAVRPEDLVVRDGMTVEASGTLVVRDGQPVRFCAPAMETADLRPGDANRPRCGWGITVVGADPDALTNPQSANGTRFGQARLRGTWQAGTLTVTEQGPPVVRPPSFIPHDTPCPPPPGGWVNGPSGDSNALHDYVYREHPEQFRPIYVTYPNGIQSGPSPPGDVPVVMVVEVVRGDVDQARAELQRRYHDNLCVVTRPGQPSIADQERVQQELRSAMDTLMRDQTNGIFAAWFQDLRPVFQLMMVTPQLLQRMAELGLGGADFDAWLRPVR